MIDECYPAYTDIALPGLKNVKCEMRNLNQTYNFGKTLSYLNSTNNQTNTNMLLPHKMIAFPNNSTNTSNGENVKATECTEAVPLVANTNNSRLRINNHIPLSQRPQNASSINGRGKSQTSPKHHKITNNAVVAVDRPQT